MARTRTKPFSRTEMKILVYNKMKHGLGYYEALEEVKKDVEQCLAIPKKKEAKKLYGQK